MVVSASFVQVQGLVLQGALVEASNALCHMAQTEPALDWVGLTAKTIAGFDHDATVRQAVITDLLSSPPVEQLFSSVDIAESAVLRAVSAIAPGTIPSFEEAFERLVKGFPDWEESAAYTSLASVVRAGGLGELVLQYELAHGAFDRANLETARLELHRARDNFQEEYADFRRSDLIAQLANFHQFKATPAARELSDARSDDREFFHRLGQMQFLKSFIYRTYPVHISTESGQRPRFLTNLLRGMADSDRHSNGSCTPAVALAADLGVRAGMQFYLLHHVNHTNLLHADTGLVFDPTMASEHELSTLQLWRDVGIFGPDQEPAPLAALLTSVTNNIVLNADQAPNSAERLYAGVRKIDSGASSLHITQSEFAMRRGDVNDALDSLQQALDINPLDFRAHFQRYRVLRRHRGLAAGTKAGERALQVIEEVTQRARKKLPHLALLTMLRDMAKALHENLVEDYLLLGDEMSATVHRLAASA